MQLTVANPTTSYIQGTEGGHGFEKPKTETTGQTLEKSRGGHPGFRDVHVDAGSQTESQPTDNAGHRSRLLPQSAFMILVYGL